MRRTIQSILVVTGFRSAITSSSRESSFIVSPAIDPVRVGVMILKRLVSLLGAVALFGLPSAALADGKAIGRITKLSYDPAAVYILTDATKTDNPACSVSTNQFAVPLTNTTAIAFLLTARANGTVVTVGGTGACTTVAGIENFNWVGY